MRCISKEKRQILILAASAVGFVILMGLLIHETISSTDPKNERTIILAVPTCVLFMVMVAMVYEMRHVEVYELRVPDNYNYDRL